MREVEWSQRLSTEHIEHGLTWIRNEGTPPARTPWGERYLVCLCEDQIETIRQDCPSFPEPLGEKTDLEADLPWRFEPVGLFRDGLVCLVDFVSHD